jgi:hypothetical protein
MRKRRKRRKIIKRKKIKNLIKNKCSIYTMNKNNIPFWGNDPYILLNNEYIIEIFPTPKMNTNQKMNALTRFIVLLSILAFIFTISFKFILIGFITLAIVYFVGITNTKNDGSYKKKVEGFDGNNHFESTNEYMGSGSNNTKLLNPETLEAFLKTDFESTNYKNPLGNVLLTQIYDCPDRKSAPPSFNNEVYDDITSSIKKMVQKLNPTIKNTNKQLFGDLYEKQELDFFQRNFYTTPNTKVTNDQGAYGEYLYGDMPSAKGVSPEDNLQREKDSYRYTLY